MKKKSFEEVAEKVIEENKELFNDLANSLWCPGCNRVVRGPFYNLGIKYSWSEGCKECYEQIQKG